jgi:hypothetical protein
MPSYGILTSGDAWLETPPIAGLGEEKFCKRKSILSTGTDVVNPCPSKFILQQDKNTFRCHPVCHLHERQANCLRRRRCDATIPKPQDKRFLLSKRRFPNSSKITSQPRADRSSPFPWPAERTTDPAAMSLDPS